MGSQHLFRSCLDKSYASDEQNNSSLPFVMGSWSAPLPPGAIVRRPLDRGEDTEPLSPETIADIQASLDEIRRGEFVAHEELKRDLEIE